MVYPSNDLGIKKPFQLQILDQIKVNRNKQDEYVKLIRKTENYDEWIKYISDRPFNDCRYYISANKLKSLGWSQKKTHEDLINFLRV